MVDLHSTIVSTGPTIASNVIYSKLFLLISLGAGFVYVAFSILFFFRIQSLHRSLHTQAGKIIVLLSLANVIIAITISILGLLLSVV